MATEQDLYDPHIGLEAWRYTGAGKLYLKKYTGKYGEIMWEAVHGGRAFHLTSAERRLNSETCRLDSNDVFKNGTCIPLALTENTPVADRAFIEANPEILSDAELAELFKGKGAKGDSTLAERLEDITNTITLARILDAAMDADLPVSKISLIRLRLAEVSGITENGRVMIPVTNEMDTPEIYGDERSIQARNGVAGVTVGS